MPAIMNRVPGPKTIHYFSDGCGGQNKNKFNFLNVCSHADDFQVPYEWKFFTTSHDRGVCDGSVALSSAQLTARASGVLFLIKF